MSSVKGKSDGSYSNVSRIVAEMMSGGGAGLGAISAAGSAMKQAQAEQSAAIRKEAERKAKLEAGGELTPEELRGSDIAGLIASVVDLFKGGDSNAKSK